MKKIVLFVTLLVTVSISATAQDSTDSKALSQLLTHYYSLTDALVAGNNNLAATHAHNFLRTLNSIDYKIISEGNARALLKDATAIEETKDLQKQREIFANLSANMATLAKSIKLSDKPIYQAYCPMKKAVWLTPDSTIKNPYYGNAMLNCGSVTETIR